MPAAINRGLAPIRRSFSFGKDLNRVHEKPSPYRTLGAHWYNSLVSLAEDRVVDDPPFDQPDEEDLESDGENEKDVEKAEDDVDRALTIEKEHQLEVEDEFGGRILARAQSLIEKNSVSSEFVRVYLRAQRIEWHFSFSVNSFSCIL